MKGKIEMTTLTVGDKISFEYIDRPVKKDSYPQQVEHNHSVREYEGEVTDVRDIQKHKLSHETVLYNQNIKGDRSQYLVTVKLPDDSYKCFYHGRIFGVQKRDRKSMIKKLIGLIKNK
tara:strand:+ start:864 stop:1217 length:354 start_codon:yes stop_codon:yes gene_type:complete